MVKALLINGSNTVQSRLTGVQQEVESKLQQRGIGTEVLYVHQLPAQDLILANFASTAIVEAVEKVEKSDIIVLLTPIYKASFTGILKTFLDLLPQKAFVNKLIVPVAIGGSIGHLLAIDYALKPVATALGATHITQTVYVVDQQVERLNGGHFAVEAQAVLRISQQIDYISSISKETIR
ncbi:MAG: NADPH-dependent FMN reductase [Kurthia sp.]|nr:NADPH-dependent FMN reductase [Candidatus Kurthia equi]